MAKKTGTVRDKMVKVKVLIPFEGHKKGETIEVAERKVRDSSRMLKRGFVKPL